MTDRLTDCFAALKAANRAGFVAFVTAGDPDLATSAQLLAGLPAAGVDIIELGMAFSDPIADGLAIQQANLRAFKAGITVSKTLNLLRDFRANDATTPVVLMGYYNPIHNYGTAAFLRDAKDAGADGLIIVDLPPEEDAELNEPAREAGLHVIRLVTPTTDAKRLPTVLRNASGFLYYVSVAGITGGAAADAGTVAAALAAIRRHTDLPIACGFGITTPEQAVGFARIADAVVVGSAIVNRIAGNLDQRGRARTGLVADVLAFTGALALATRDARA